MQPIKTVIKKHWPKLTIVLWLVLQIPFLTADLPGSLSYSRGPYSDEGLNTFAVRNLINSNFQELSESDNFIKSPVLNAYLFTPFLVFQNDLLAGRIAMLLLVALLLFLFVKHLRMGWVVVFSFLLMPIIFHFSRLMMGDFVSAFIPLVALLILMHRIEFQKSISVRVVFALTLFASLGFGMKIQSIAMLAFFVMTVVAYLLHKGASLKNYLAVLVGVLPMVLVFGFVLLNQLDLAEYIFSQVPEYYEHEALSLSQVFDQNGVLHLKSTQGRILIVAWLLSGLLIVMLAAKYEWKKLLYATPFILATLYQFSGMYMVYFPPRYVLGLYVSSVVLMVVLINATHVFFPKMPQFLASITVIGLVVMGGLDYKKAFESRTFNLNEMNQEISQKENINRMMGSWASSLNFHSTDILAYPIWESYLTFKKISNPIEYYNPGLIVAEPNEDDSGWAYKKLGIDLKELPVQDSITVGKFQLIIYANKP